MYLRDVRAGRAPRGAFLLVLSFVLQSTGCERDPEPRSEPEAPERPRLEAAPQVLDWSREADAQGVPIEEATPVPDAPPVPQFVARGGCPADMVSVAGAFCIDRYEVSLVDAARGRRLSPHYPPTRAQTRDLFERWRRKQATATTELGRLLGVPAPPAFQLEEDFVARAISERGALPHGYLSRDAAESACRAAGKRLCRREEWVRACRGQEDTKFPYGPTYRHGVCNVHRDAHPASLLHGNASIHHLDPRLPLVRASDGPLLQPTGASAECRSRWGDDAVYDMVGNLDEWIDDPSGVFLGGFYSRASRDGCDASISSHAPSYFDYSLGARCCRDPGT